MQDVLLPALKQMGAEVSLTVNKYGFFPDVVGSVTLNVNALQAPL